MALPSQLQAAIDRELEHVERSRVTRAAQQISADYKVGKFTGSLESPEARAAYLVTRLPATYAASQYGSREVRRLAPDFQPSSVLDLGAGPGTASWAALETWPTITQANLVESNHPMMEVGQRLASGHDVLKRAEWVNSDLRHANLPPADLVVLSYALGELSVAEEAIRQAWAAARQMMVVIEPGTPKTFATIAQARRTLIADGAHMVAPCPHMNECPMWLTNDWCHFAVRLERTSEHRQMKGGALGYEDEKFSYLAFSKSPVQQAEARVVRHPLVHSGHIQLTLCEPTRLTHRTITRSNKEAFRAARKTKWGDEWH